MRKFIQMVVVLSAICFVAGLALGSLNSLTQEQIDNNVLRFKKLPAVIDVVQTYEKDLDDADRTALEDQLLKDRRMVAGEDGEQLVFMTRRNDAPYSYVIESKARGYGGPVTVMVGIDADGCRLTGIGIATHSETPGVGSRIVEDAFTGQFPWSETKADFRIKKDGGVVDGVSGATYSSRAVSEAISQAIAFYNTHGEKIRAAFAQ